MILQDDSWFLRSPAIYIINLCFGAILLVFSLTAVTVCGYRMLKAKWSGKRWYINTVNLIGLATAGVRTAYLQTCCQRCCARSSESIKCKFAGHVGGCLSRQPHMCSW